MLFFLYINKKGEIPVKAMKIVQAQRFEEPQYRPDMYKNIIGGFAYLNRDIQKGHGLDFDVYKINPETKHLEISHRHTSTVESVDHILDTIAVKTKNTRYVFHKDDCISIELADPKITVNPQTGFLDLKMPDIQEYHFIQHHYTIEFPIPRELKEKIIEAEKLDALESYYYHDWAILIREMAYGYHEQGILSSFQVSQIENRYDPDIDVAWDTKEKKTLDAYQEF